jgi:uncharacterized protein (TIGR03086 family)
MNESVLPFLRRAVDEVGPVVAFVAAAEFDRPTPCADFDLKTVTAHLIGGLRGFAAVGEGKPFEFGSDPDLTATSPATAFHAEADRMLAAFAEPGMETRTFPMPWGDTTGAQLLGFELIEVLVHGWDIARSLDRAPAGDNELALAALGGARLWVDDSVRTPQMFGPEVILTPEAGALDQLVAFLGRHPSWKAPTALS